MLGFAGFGKTPDWEQFLPLYSTVNGKKVAWTYQTDRADFISAMRKNEANWRWVLRYKKEATGVVTFRNEAYTCLAVEAVFRNAVWNESFAIIQIYGPSESGKSELAKAKAFELAFHHWEYTGEWPRIVLTFSMDEARRLPKRLSPRSIIICDEQSFVSGQDSVTSEKALHSILKACRRWQVSFIFVDPEDDTKPNVNYKLRIIRTAREISLTQSAVITTHGNIVGIDNTWIPFDHWKFQEIFADYDEQKDAFIEQLTSQDGQFGTTLDEVQTEYAEELFAYAKKQGYNITKRQLELFIVELHWEHLTFSTRENVVQRVLNMAKDEAGLNVPACVPTQEWTTLDGEIVDFREAVFNTMVELGGNPKHVDAMQRFCNKESAASIGEGHGVGSTAVSNWMARLHTILGDAFEIMYSRLLSNKGVSNKRYGGSSHYSDIVIYGDNEEPVAVYSLKCRRDSRVKKYTFHRDDFAPAELELAAKHGVPLFLVFYDIYHDVLYEPIEDDGEREDFVFILGHKTDRKKGNVFVDHIHDAIRRGLEQTFTNEAQFFEACKALAKTAGIAGLMKVLHKRGDLKKTTIDKIVEQITRELAEVK